MFVERLEHAIDDAVDRTLSVQADLDYLARVMEKVQELQDASLQLGGYRRMNTNPATAGLYTYHVDRGQQCVDKHRDAIRHMLYTVLFKGEGETK